MEIFEFCKAIIRDDPYDSSAVDRHEKVPEIHQLGENKFRQIYELAKKEKEEGYKKIAIITKTAEKATEIFDNNKTYQQYFNLINTEECVLKDSINIIPTYFAKGLEFDYVIIPDADEEYYYDEADKRILYTACSRALHKLSVCYEKKLSNLIKKWWRSYDGFIR